MRPFYFVTWRVKCPGHGCLYPQHLPRSAANGGEITKYELRLVSDALAAVRQWKYKPYFLNGQPVEVETQVTVKFTLNR